jgi:hypothetical protein
MFSLALEAVLERLYMMRVDAWRLRACGSREITKTTRKEALVMMFRTRKCIVISVATLRG